MSRELGFVDGRGLLHLNRMLPLVQWASRDRRAGTTGHGLAEERRSGNQQESSWCELRAPRIENLEKTKRVGRALKKNGGKSELSRRAPGSGPRMVGAWLVGWSWTSETARQRVRPGSCSEQCSCVAAGCT